MNFFKNTLLISVLSIILVSCMTKETAFTDPLEKNSDTTVTAGDDFFNHVNGRWFKNNPIPDTESTNGIFKTVDDTINAQIHSVCENAAKDSGAKKGSNQQKIGDFYASGMDTVAIEKANIQSLKPYLKCIDTITNVSSLFGAIGYLNSIGVTPAFSFNIWQDDKITTKHAIWLTQGGLGLDNRDYYFNTDTETVNIRKAYEKHIAAIFSETGSVAATQNAATVMQIETEFAKASRKIEALRDPNANYHKMDLKHLNTLTPNINWNTVIRQFGITKADTIIIGQPEFYIALNKMLKTHAISEWKTYLKWNLIHQYAPYLNKVIADEHFRFYGTVLNGITKQKPRWKRITDQTNFSLGELIGQIYVSDYLPKGSKQKLLEIGNTIRTVYAAHIKKLDWMSEATKQKALLKLSKVVMKVGYPDKWKDLSSIIITRGSYCENILAVRKWKYKYMINKFGQPVNRTEWDILPQTYNAYYNPANNEIVVPACNIIIPGFEGRIPDDAILYAIIGGATFGHEITHGFDDQGSQYDSNGNLKSWWTAEDLLKFKAKTKRIVAQFNKYEVLPGKFINGDATQGENIADLGGITMGLEAFKQTEQYKNNIVIGGLTPKQRYFAGYAYQWMVNYKKETLANMLLSDVHSPPKYRVNGILSNIPEFYNAFNVKPGNKMYLADSLRVAIW